MRKLTLLPAHLVDFFSPERRKQREHQALVDATEDRMVYGPPITEEQKKLRQSMLETRELLEKQPMKVTQMLIREDDFDDIARGVPAVPKDK